jgi:hypothetical protein
VPPVSTETPCPAPRSCSATTCAPADGAALALAERVGLRDAQRDRLAGDDVHERPALLAGEDGRVELLRVLARLRIMPPRAPPSVLWIVVVTTSACGTGDGCTPAATSPAKWAMSTMSSAPTASAISRKRAKSRNRGYADQPAMMSFGRRSSARRATSSMSTSESSSRTWYGTMSYRRPERLIFMPCVRWPPCGSARPMIVSPGCSSAW